MNVADGLPETTIAMVQASKVEISQDHVRLQGHDDYTVPFDRIMDAFDSFISEFSNGKLKAGYLEVYDMSKPRDLTIYLLWQIRHIRTHSGGLISDKQEAKIRYERQFKNANERCIAPVIDLPEILDSGEEISFEFEDYKVIKEVIFEYIAERIPKKDLEILKARSAISNIETQQVLAVFELGDLGLVEIDLAKTYDLGFYVDSRTGILNAPPHTTYFPRLSQICVTTVFKCVPVKILDPIDNKGKRKGN